jgi:Pyruvate/2-oxoglutarate dehydrogenase complex, dihydrolipoamide dehydrogenase (E3) component, and related enzymes
MLAKAASLLTAASVVAMSSAASPITQKISRDVVVVGGGAAGAYAAVRLREDYGKSIALVEKEARLVSNYEIIPSYMVIKA